MMTLVITIAAYFTKGRSQPSGASCFCVICVPSEICDPDETCETYDPDETCVICVICVICGPCAWICAWICAWLCDWH